VLDFFRQLWSIPLRREFACVLIAFLPAAFATSQQSDQPIPRPAFAQPASVTVYYAGPGVTAPVLFPPTVSISLPRHCNHYDGMAKLSAIVDENGVPRNIDFQSSDARLGNFAIGVVADQRFKPGTHNGIPAPVAIDLTLGLQTCLLPTKSADGNEPYEMTLRSHPAIAIDVLGAHSASPEEANSVPANASELIPDPAPGLYKVGGRISPPSLIHEVEPEYSDYGQQNRITGICAIGLIVDTNGVPRNVHVIKGLEPSMDDNAMDAVKQYRFKPAMMDGTTPVPVEITVEVNFKLVNKKKRF
jgi:TonB family protein